MRLIFKILRRLRITIKVVLITISVLVLPPVAFSSGRNTTDLAPPDLPDKGNPKLDSQLNQLVHAESQGEATLFAEQNDIELIDGEVRVIIECVPGQLELATEAVTDADARLETSYDSLLQVVAPIDSLNTLADTASIRFIRLPQYPLPGASN